MNFIDKSSEFYTTWSKEYTVDCTGDCVRGDEVVFERAVFTGSYKNPKFSHMEVVRGRIIKESYGAEKQQHTFTIETFDCKKIRVKGRNLYKNGTLRKLWTEEAAREKMNDEKHTRGQIAREKRSERKNNFQ